MSREPRVCDEQSLSFLILEQRVQIDCAATATALKGLAHPNRGLGAVVRVTERAPCFALDSADLSSTCARIRSVVA